MQKFIEERLKIFDDQYPYWKTNGSGKAPICIPEAPDVCDDKRTLQTIEHNVQAHHLMHERKMIAKKLGNLAEKMVHQAFQGSKIGGILMQNVKTPSPSKLKDILKLSDDELKRLKKRNGMKLSVFISNWGPPHFFQ